MSEGGSMKPVNGFVVEVGNRFRSLAPNGRLWEVTGETGYGWELQAVGGPRPGCRSDGRPLAMPRRIFRGTAALADPKKWERR